MPYQPEEDPRFLGEVFDQDEWRAQREMEMDDAQELERLGSLRGLYENEAWPLFEVELQRIREAHHGNLLSGRCDSMAAVEQARSYIKALDAVLDMPRRNVQDFERVSQRLSSLSEAEPAR